MKKIIHRTAIIVIASIFLVMFLVFVSGAALAADPLKLDPNVAIPGDDFKALTEIDFTNEKSTKPIALYIRALFKYGIGVVGVLSSVVLMWGGVIWLTAGGNASRIGEAKAWIGGALTGLILALSSFLLLSTINPELVDLKVRTIKDINPQSVQTSTLVNTVEEYFLAELSGDKCGRLYGGPLERQRYEIESNRYADECSRVKCGVSISDGLKYKLDIKIDEEKDVCRYTCYCSTSGCWNIHTSKVINPKADAVYMGDGTGCVLNAGESGGCVSGKCEICYNQDKVVKTKDGVQGYCDKGVWKQAKGQGYRCSDTSADYECINGDCYHSTAVSGGSTICD